MYVSYKFKRKHTYQFSKLSILCFAYIKRCVTEYTTTALELLLNGEMT